MLPKYIYIYLYIYIYIYTHTHTHTHIHDDCYILIGDNHLLHQNYNRKDIYFKFKKTNIKYNRHFHNHPLLNKLIKKYKKYISLWPNDHKIVKLIFAVAF